jgi:hypothetical protein
MVDMGSRRAAPTDTAREKEQHHTDILIINNIIIFIKILTNILLYARL